MAKNKREKKCKNKIKLRVNNERKTPSNLYLLRNASMRVRASERARKNTVSLEPNVAPNDAYQLAVVKAREPTTLWRERNANVFRTISDEIQWKRNQH